MLADGKQLPRGQMCIAQTPNQVPWTLGSTDQQMEATQIGTEVEVLDIGNEYTPWIPDNRHKHAVS